MERPGVGGIRGRRCRPKRLVTAEDWAPYGIGEPDVDGWYPDYRQVPEHLRAPAPDSIGGPGEESVDASLLAIICEWRIVIADLAKHYGIDLYDPAVRARPWPGIRTMIFALLDEPTRLRAALTRR